MIIIYSTNVVWLTTHSCCKLVYRLITLVCFHMFMLCHVFRGKFSPLRQRSFSGRTKSICLALQLSAGLIPRRYLHVHITQSDIWMPLGQTNYWRGRSITRVGHCHRSNVGRYVVVMVDCCWTLSLGSVRHNLEVMYRQRLEPVVCIPP